MATRQVREILVKIDTKGDQSLKQIAAGFGRMNRNVAEGTGVLKRFEAAYARLATISFAGIGITGIISALDAFQKLNDRLNITEGSTEKAAIALEKLQIVAGSVRSSVSETSNLYTRLNQSLMDLNLGSDAVLGVTLSLQNAFKVYGATAAEANAATIQLSQGLASGGLRGQELRSVLEASGFMGEILAKKLGIARGELIKFAEKNNGIKTPVILEALVENFDRLQTMADKLNPTVGEAMTMALDKATIALGKLNQEYGGTKKLAEAIIFLGDNANTLLKIIGYAAGAWLAYKSAVIAAAAAQGTLALAQGVMSAAIALQLIGFKALTVAVWGFVAAKTAALAVLGPIGLVIAALGVAYGIYTGIQRENNRTSEKELSLAEKKLRAQDNLYRFQDAKNKAERENAQNLVEINQETHDHMRLLAEQSGWTQKVTTGVGVFRDALREATESLKNKALETFNFSAAMKAINAQWRKDGDLNKYTKALKDIQIKKLNEEFDKGEKTVAQYNKELAEIKFGKSMSSLKMYRGELGALNSEFAGEVYQGRVRGYASALEDVKLDKLTRDLKEGRTNFLEFNKGVRNHELGEFNRAMAEGNVQWHVFNSGTQEIKLKQLNEEWRAGIIDIYEYNKAVTEVSDKFQPGSALFTGTANYISQAGTLSQNVATMVTNTFGNLEQTFLDFTKTGKFAFKDFAMAVLEDLNRIIIRSLIIRPLAQGLLNFATPSAAGTSTAGSTDAAGSYNNYAAKGAAFEGARANFFASGGVVSGRTNFGFGGGKRGVMGEAGPEAILPLSRNSNGELGVKSSGGDNVVINIINQSDGKVEQRESKGPNGERMLDILITTKVKEGFANGTFDKQMNTNYGLRRRGA